MGGRIGFFSPKLGALALSNGCVAMAQGAKTVFVSIGTTPIFQERCPTSKAPRSALYAKGSVVIADAEWRRGARSVLPGRFPSYSGSGLVMDELQQAASFVPSKR